MPRAVTTTNVHDMMDRLTQTYRDAALLRAYTEICKQLAGKTATGTKIAETVWTVMMSHVAQKDSEPLVIDEQAIASVVNQLPQLLKPIPIMALITVITPLEASDDAMATHRHLARQLTP